MSGRKVRMNTNSSCFRKVNILIPFCHHFIHPAIVLFLTSQFNSPSYRKSVLTSRDTPFKAIGEKLEQPQKSEQIFCFRPTDLQKDILQPPAIFPVCLQEHFLPQAQCFRQTAIRPAIPTYFEQIPSTQYLVCVFSRSDSELQKTCQLKRIIFTDIQDIKSKIEIKSSDSKDAILFQHYKEAEKFVKSIESTLNYNSTIIKRLKCLDSMDKKKMSVKEFLETIKENPCNEYDIVRLKNIFN